MTLADILLQRVMRIRDRVDLAKEDKAGRLVEVSHVASDCLTNKLLTQNEYDLIAERAGILF